MDVHKKIHATGVTARDFIIIYYVQAKLPINLHKDSDCEDNFQIGTSKYQLKNTKVSSVKFNASKLAKSKGYTKYNELAHFYCPTCKCYMKINKISDKHYVGQCNTTRPTSTCKSCGLRFTKKTLQRHSKLHKKFPKLKLKELKFTNIQTKKRINPPYPIFKKCKLCEVNFFSVLALKNHSCNAEEPKICAFCNKKFSDLAYNLHIQFHEYPTKNKMNRKNDSEMNDVMAENHINDKMAENENIPELIKKYRSLEQVWNILFLCKACDIVIDTYDKVVEHCQDHFCNMQSYNITIKHCNICDLNFVEECYKKHQELHLSDDFDKDSFKILKYKYENLLSDDWSEIFASLTKEQIDLILSKSMYKFTRCVRMKAVSNGPYNLTLYRCGKCNVIIAPNRVAKHSQNNRCEGARKFTCSVCKLRFAYKSQKIIHESLHEFKKLNVKSFRIIEFHADNQFSVTELKHNEIAELNVGEGKQKKKPDGLKFIRCQHCGKLINKHRYKSHIKYHHYYDKTKANKKIVYNFYKCKQCNLCVGKNTVQRHICENYYSKKKCPKCPLFFRSQNLASHYKYHEKFSRNSMNIIYFENGVILKKANKNPMVANKFYNKGLTNNKSIGKAFVGTNKFQNKILTYYQCSKCTMCIWHEANINRHACSSEPSRITCEKCGITCLSSRKQAHDKMHSIRNFNRKNIKLIQFSDKKIINNVATNCIAQKRKPQSTNETVAKKPRIDRTFNKYKTNSEASVPEFKGSIAKKPRISIDDDRLTTCDFEDETKDVSVEQSMRDSRCPLHNIYYKCNICKILFVTGTGLVEHANVCEQNRDFQKCNSCGFAFHTSEIELHYKTQNCSNDMEVVYLLTLRQTGKLYKRGNNWIYLCKKCDLYYMTYSSINYHFKRNHETKCAIRSCEMCNINFTTITHTKHLKTHHGKKETLISDLSIAEIADIPMEVALQDLPGDNNDATSNTEEKTQVSDCDMKSDENVANAIECSSNAETSAHRTTLVRKSGIYQCEKCGLNFVHPKSLVRHKMYNKHDEVHYACEICDLRFTRMSLKKHIAIHHVKEAKKKVTNSKTDFNDSVVESIHKMFYDHKPNSKTDSSAHKYHTVNNYENISGVSNPDNQSLEPVSSNFEANSNKVEITKKLSKSVDIFANETINNKPTFTEETNRSGKSTPN
ncbi:jg26901, partial [Pararge aegeria aegeria]